MRPRLSAVLVLACAFPAFAADRQRFSLDDLARFESVSDPQVSPDGTWVAYVVESVDRKKDDDSRDLWMTRWDGAETVRLTASPEDDSQPRFSPDGREIAFLSARGDDATTQVWLLNRAGGEAQALTNVAGEVEDFAWAPDGKRLALIVSDPDPAPADGDAPDTARPIVVDRYHFKQDYTGYLTDQRSHLYVFDRATRQATQVLSGAFDETMPCWSPDGKQILFVSKRDGDPDRGENYDLYLVEPKAGAVPRKLTTFPGVDNLPDWDSRPVWSPDGTTIAYARLGTAEDADEFYGPPEIATIAAAGGEPKRLTASVDRWMLHPQFSSDGAWLYFQLEDDRSVTLARVPTAGGPVERLLPPGRVVSAVAAGKQGVAVIAETGTAPGEVQVLEGSTLRPLTTRNAAVLATLELGAVEAVDLQSQDGTPIGAMLVKPPQFKKGVRYPLMLWIHGGPVMQDQHAFDSFAQYFAAQGYLVLSPNYRGSAGKGFAFARAISGDWGHLEVKDVLGAVDGLVAQGLADPQRLVVGGWSYGGMMTNYVIASDTRFKAAASIAGVSNMLGSYGTDQYVSWYERELGLPWKGLDKWLKVSYPFYHADRITTPTMFLCGEKDWNVPLVNSEQMFQALKSLGVDAKLVIYPGAHHGIDAPSYQRDILERMTAWYATHLGK